jgi:hypothetical protein
LYTFSPPLDQRPQSSSPKEAISLSESDLDSRNKSLMLGSMFSMVAILHWAKEESLMAQIL